jgi:RNA polymerase sigma-70 factor (ECF subfamily)
MDFEGLVNEHKDAVYRQMIRTCGNREDAEDVLIDALLKAYRNLDQLRAQEAFRAWLGQIARRVCWQLRKREALLPILQLSELESEGQELAGNSPALDAALAMQQMKELLMNAVEALPEQYRDVYRLRDLEELSGEEVSQALSINLQAMKSRLHRARAMVRESLDSALGQQVKRYKESNHGSDS